MGLTFSKPSLTYVQQIQNLRAKGMLISDAALAEYWLRHVSYYRLSAYWLYFEKPKNAAGLRFRSGTTFEDATRQVDPWFSAGKPVARVIVEGHAPGSYGGTGTRADLELVEKIALRYPIVLAGGAFAAGLALALLRAQLARGAASGMRSLGRHAPLSSRRRRVLAAFGR